MTDLDKETLQHIDQLNDIVPSEASTRRAISRARAALVNQPEPLQTTLPRHKARRLTWRYVAAACVALSATLIVGLFLLGQDSVAFAEVQREMRKTRTVIYNYVCGPPEKKTTSRQTISGTRQRIDEPGVTVIIVPDKKVMLRIDHKRRTAEYRRDNSGKKPKPSDPYGHIASIAEGSVKEIGRATIDGKSVIGFEVPEVGLEDGPPMKVWVDPNTRLPVKVVAAGNRVLCDFQFGVDVPEELFKLDAPKGYLVENRYAAPQKSLALPEDKLRKYRATADDPGRSARETIDAFLKLASAGEISLAQAMQNDPERDNLRRHDLRKLDGFDRLELKQVFVADQAALGITSGVIVYRGKRVAIAVVLCRLGETWYVDDIDLEPVDRIQREIKRFEKRHPSAKLVE